MIRPLRTLGFLWLLAKRDLLGARRTAVLLMTVIAVPVLALTAAGTILTTTALSPADQARYSIAAADYRLSYGPQVPDPPTLPGENRRVAETDARGAVVDAAGVRSPVDVRDLPPSDPMVQGIITVLSGSAPTRPGDVAVSRALLRDQHRQVGGSITMDQPPGSFRIVGVIQDPLSRNGRLLLLPPGSGAALPADLVVERRVWLQGPGLNVTGLTEQGVQTLNRTQAVGIRTSPIAPGDQAIAIAMVLFAVVVVCAGALAVIARRQAREVAILAANGATRSHAVLRLLAYAAPLGVGGALLGALLGTGAGALSVPLAQRLSDHVVAGLTIPVATTIVVTTLAACSAMAAALVTGLVLGRGRPRQLLAAPVTTTRGAAQAAAAGAVLLVFGSAFASSTGRAAGVAVLALISGTALFTPIVLRLLSGGATPLPLAWRTGLRDASRHATRTTPAVAALVVTVACAVAASSYLLTGDHARRAAYLPELATNQAVVRSISSEGPIPQAAAQTAAASLPVRELEPLLVAHTPDADGTLAYVGPAAGTNPVTNLYVGDDQTLDAFGAASQTAAFHAGAVVVLDQALAPAGQTVVSWTRPGGDGYVSTTRPAVVVPQDPTNAGPRAIINQATARNLGLVTTQRGYIIKLSSPPSTAAITEAEQSLHLFPGVELVREVGYQSEANRQVLVVVATAALFALLTTLTVATLVTQELVSFLSTLRAIGARQRTTLLIAGVQAAAGALTGTLLGILAGLLAATRLTAPNSTSVVLPWAALALALLILPTLTGAAGALAARSERSS